MAVRVLALLSFNKIEGDALAEYLKLTEPLINRAQGKVVSNFPIAQSATGPEHVETALIVEYPDNDAVRSVFESKEYELAKPYRDKAFSYYSVTVIEGVDGNVGEFKLD